MSLLAPVVDGKLQTSSTSSESLAKSSNKSSVDSDTFLTLLVAEMQNQDPLEPTSNTEWVSQYATFTQVEQMTEMGESMDLLRANSMIGKEVVMKVTSESTGETSYKRGTVDYVTVEDGEALLVIDEEKYSISDLDSVASDEYFTAYDLYTEFVGMMDALPSLNLLDKSYENTVGKVYDLYNNLNEYQKNYIDKYASSYVESYKAYIKKMEQIGITYGETEATEEKKVATLDDVLEAFNTKMDALMTQLTALNGNIQSSSSGSQSSDSTSAGSTDAAESTAGSTQGSDSTDGNGTVDGTQSSGETDNQGSTDAAESTGGTEGSEAAEGTQSSGETEGSEAAGGTQSSGETGDSDATSDAAGEAQVAEQAAEQSGDDAEATDDMLDQLTQDTTNV